MLALSIPFAVKVDQTGGGASTHVLNRGWQCVRSPADTP
jgi:hypothetical protein